MKPGKWMTFFVLICCLPSLFIACGDDDDDNNNNVTLPIPTIPAELKAQSEDNGVTLTWKAGQNTARYNIYRSAQQSEGFALIGTANQTTFKDTNVQPDTTYFYKVAGVSPKVEGAEIEGDRSPPVQVIYVVAVLTVETKAIDFGQRDSTKPLTIKNSGGAPLEWEIKSDAKWLTFDPAKGTLAGKKEQVITVRADRGQNAGQYKATITVAAKQDKPITIPATLEIPEEPMLSVTPTAIDFGTERAPQLVQIENSGTGTLAWTAKKEKDVPWLGISPVSGNVKGGDPQPLTLELFSAELDKLPPGKQTETILISGAGEEKSVTVTVEIAAMPIPAVNPTSVAFGEARGSRTVQISNAGTGVLQWTARKVKNEAWLRVTPASGSVGAGNGQPLTLETVGTEIDGLAPGNYSETVIVEGGGDQKSITVTIIVPQPALELSQNQIDFGDALDRQTIQVRNIGQGTLQWQASSPQSWVVITPANGSTQAGLVSSVRIEVDRATLETGPHNAGVTFSGNGGTKALTINLLKVGHITGAIRDLHTNQPISGARVALPTREVRTGPDGRFDLTFDTDGRYTFTAQASGYIDRQTSVQTQLGVAEADVFLSPIAQKVGEIRDAVRLTTPKRIAYAGERAYVTNELDDTVVVINTATDSVLLSIPLVCEAFGCKPKGIAANPDHPEVYVASADSDQISIINTNTNRDARQIKVGDFPSDCAVSHDGSTLYVSNQREGTVSVISLDTQSVVDGFQVGQAPAGLVVSPDDAVLYVSNSDGDSVSVIDLRAGAEISKVPVGRQPDAITIAEDGRYVYVVNTGSGDLSVIDRSTQTATRVGVTPFPVGVAASRESDGREIAYVVDIDGTISVVEMPSRTVIQDIGVRGGAFVEAIGYDAAHGTFYALDSDQGRIVVLK